MRIKASYEDGIFSEDFKNPGVSNEACKANTYLLLGTKPSSYFCTCYKFPTGRFSHSINQLCPGDPGEKFF